MTERRVGLGKHVQPSDVVNLFCGICGALLGIYDRNDRSTMLLIVIEHMEERHKWPGATVLLEGEDFYTTPRLYRCDLCNDQLEPPAWEYRTFNDDTLTCPDPAWAVCDLCAQLVELGDPAALALRSMLVQGMQQQLDDSGLTKLIAPLYKQMQLFLSHREPDRRRDTV